MTRLKIMYENGPRRRLRYIILLLGVTGVASAEGRETRRKSANSKRVMYCVTKSKHRLPFCDASGIITSDEFSRRQDIRVFICRFDRHRDIPATPAGTVSSSDIRRNTILFRLRSNT